MTPKLTKNCCPALPSKQQNEVPYGATDLRILPSRDRSVIGVSQSIELEAIIDISQGSSDVWGRDEHLIGTIVLRGTGRETRRTPGGG